MTKNQFWKGSTFFVFFSFDLTLKIISNSIFQSFVQEWVCTKMIHKNGSVDRQCERTYVMINSSILFTCNTYLIFDFYRTRVRSLAMLVSNWLTHSLTNSLTDCRLVNLIDVTLVCEDGNSKLVEVVTVVDVDAEDNVGNSLLQIWELRFCHKAKLLFRLLA